MVTALPQHHSDRAERELTAGDRRLLAERPVMPAEEASACYAQAVRTWGRAHISADVDVERFNQLAQRLIDSADADADALPLFAGWRAQPCPGDDPAGAAMRRVHVLREHRGACHLAAVRLCGLSARAAMITNLGVSGQPSTAGRIRSPSTRLGSPAGNAPSGSPARCRCRSTPV
ncbi:hypothetical protein [Streptomyces sp. NPDC085665]|uniref:helix-turn-helix domain-containing protein n=1 Tax=Streptomyces sp. NPDC085665 TaxID=3365735 RepID=UPI0037D8A5AF